MIGQDTLPEVTIRTTETNPDYVPRYQDGDVKPVNHHEYQMEIEIVAEVLQLNLSTGGMRVRYRLPDRKTGKLQTITEDVPISFFFNQYSIQEVE